MPQIKKWLPVFVVILAIASVALMPGCGDSDMVMLLAKERDVVKTSETAPATKETVAESKVNGTIYETDKFSILQPDGWKAEEASDGVNFSKGDDYVGVAFGNVKGVTEANCKELAGALAKQQNGTPVEEVTFGVKFFLTRFTTEGFDMTEGWGLTNGVMVSLVMSGKDHPNNVEIKAMLESLKFK